MAGYDAQRVPRGTSRRWEVLISEESGERSPAHLRTALDVRAEHSVLREMPETLLRATLLLDEGAALVRLHEYLDLHDPARAAFRAEGGEFVKPGQRVVAHEEVPEAAWNELCAACERVRQRTALRTAS